MRRIFFLISACLFSTVSAFESDACTGIALTAKDGSRVVARTVEWSKSPMNCGYVVVPRGHIQQSYTPTGQNGHVFRAKYGYVGIYTEYEPFVVEGVNEKGLSIGLFFFPSYGEYVSYNPKDNERTLSDMQFASWALANFSTIEELMLAISDIDVVSLQRNIGDVHWRISQPDGQVVVLEYENGIPVFYESSLGVLTNSPGFQWHLTNLNNYVNLHPGAVGPNQISVDVVLNPIGGNSGFLGLPGDFTPPSRFVRATFFQTSSPLRKTGFDTVLQAFHILNNFDIPIGVQYPDKNVPEGMPSATHFTAATDQAALRFYYRTAYNCNIRCIDLKAIDFEYVNFQSHPLDKDKIQPIEMLQIS